MSSPDSAGETPVPLADIVRYLDEYLRIHAVPDERNAVNGLQVENQGLVGGIVAAVDASQATIDGVIAARPAASTTVIPSGVRRALPT